MTETNASPLPLKIYNVIHFADWVPQKGLSIAFSTVEPRTAAPGWQANNDLHICSFNRSGEVNDDTELIKPNSGGVYGWWGTNFSFSSDGKNLAYSRPDGVGVINLKNGKMTSLRSENPLQTRADWAWVPGISWTLDSSSLYAVVHQSKPGFSDETSPIFDLVSIIQQPNAPEIVISNQAGMFAYPSISPEQSAKRSLLAFLQSIFPDQSETSRYRLIVMDQDGSNRLELFPSSGSAGIEPQQIVWSPVVKEINTSWIGLIYQSNLWFINPITKQAQQITGDGTITRLDWSLY